MMTEEQKKMRKDGNIVLGKDYRTKYAKAIVQILYKYPCLSNNQLASHLGIASSSLCNMFRNFDLLELLIVTRKGKYAYYSLKDDVREKIDEKIKNGELNNFGDIPVAINMEKIDGNIVFGKDYGTKHAKSIVEILYKHDNLFQKELATYLKISPDTLSHILERNDLSDLVVITKGDYHTYYSLKDDIRKKIDEKVKNGELNNFGDIPVAINMKKIDGNIVFGKSYRTKYAGDIVKILYKYDSLFNNQLASCLGILPVYLSRIFKKFDLSDLVVITKGNCRTYYSLKDDVRKKIDEKVKNGELNNFGDIPVAINMEKIDGNIVFGKDYRTKYAGDIVKILYKYDSLFNNQLASCLETSPFYLNYIFKEFDLSDLVLATKEGKYAYYSLKDDVREKIDEKIKNGELNNFGDIPVAINMEKIDGNIVFGKDYGTKHAKSIVEILYKHDNLFQKELAAYLKISPSNLSNIFKKNDLSDLVVKNKAYYNLTEFARSKMDLQKLSDEQNIQEKNVSGNLENKGLSIFELIALKEILKKSSNSDSSQVILNNFDKLISIFSFSELIILFSSLNLISIEENDFDKILVSFDKNKLELTKSVLLKYLDFLDLIPKEDNKNIESVVDLEKVKKNI